MFREEPRMWGRFLHRGLAMGSRDGEVQWAWGAWELRDQDGVAFLFLFRLSCALDSFSIPSPPRPDLLDFESLKKCNAHYNLQNAFNLAEKELGLTKLLDPEGGTELCERAAVG